MVWQADWSFAGQSCTRGPTRPERGHHALGGVEHYCGYATFIYSWCAAGMSDNQHLNRADDAGDGVIGSFEGMGDTLATFQAPRFGGLPTAFGCIRLLGGRRMPLLPPTQTDACPPFRWREINAFCLEHPSLLFRSTKGKPWGKAPVCKDDPMAGHPARQART